MVTELCKFTQNRWILYINLISLMLFLKSFPILKNTIRCYRMRMRKGYVLTRQEGPQAIRNYCLRENGIHLKNALGDSSLVGNQEKKNEVFFLDCVVKSKCQYLIRGTPANNCSWWVLSTGWAVPCKSTGKILFWPYNQTLEYGDSN